MNTEMRDKIVEAHGAGMLKRSAMNIRGGAGVFEKVMSGNGYRTALEIGTYRGVSAAEMSRYCDRVVTIDLKSGRLEQLGESFDRVAFWKSIGVENVELILVADDVEKAKVIAGLEFDFAFVDGAHDATVKNDFEMTRRCGKVLFHDADDNRLRADKPNASNFVYEFLETLPQDQLEFIDIFALWSEKEEAQKVESEPEIDPEPETQPEQAAKPKLGKRSKKKNG